METMVRPAKSYGLPSLSTISKSPSTFKEPLLLTVIFVDAISFGFAAKIGEMYDV